MPPTMQPGHRVVVQSLAETPSEAIAPDSPHLSLEAMPPPDPATLEPAGRALLAAFDAGDYERMHTMFLASGLDDLPASKLKEKFTAVHEACASFASPELKGTEDQDGAKVVTFEGTCPDGVHVTSKQIWHWRAVGWKLRNLKITKDATEEPTPDPTPE